jgi:hypothetical protein
MFFPHKQTSTKLYTYMKSLRVLYYHQGTKTFSLGTLLLTILLFSIQAQAKYDWLQFDFSPDKTGNDTLETTININNVTNLQPLFTVPLSYNPDGAPVLLTDVNTPSGVRDLIFIFAEQGYTTAYDANTGELVWTKDYSTGAASSKGPQPTATAFCGGHTSNTAPAVDPNRLYVYTFGMDGNIHKLNVGDGSEVTGGGWPEPIMSDAGKAREELSIVTAANGHTYLYGNAGYEIGSQTVIDLGTGSQHVFNTVNSQDADQHITSGTYRHAMPWGHCVVYSAGLDRVFFTCGTYANFVAGHCWTESLLAITPDGQTTIANGGGYPLDSYTPSNWQALINSDSDLGGGTDIILLPDGLSSKYPYLGVMGSKDGDIRIFNLANLSGQGGPGNVGGALETIKAPVGGSMRSQGTTWTDPNTGIVWVFLAGDSGISAMQVVIDASGNPSLQTGWTLHNGWTTSAIMVNGILFAAVGGGEHSATTATHHLQAINPTNGAITWSAAIGQFHWTSPIVANGIVYMCDGNSGGFGSGLNGNLHAWSLGGGAAAVPDGTYKIVNLNSGLVIDATGQQTTNHTPVEQYTYSGGSNQLWTVTSLGGGQYKVIGLQSGRALDVVAAGTANGTAIDLFDYSGKANQRWNITATSGGNFRLSPANVAGSSLDVKSSSTANSAELEIWTSNSNNSQQWSFQTP